MKQSKFEKYFVIGFWTKDRQIQPLAWSKEEPSKKRLRSMVKKFKLDGDFDSAVCLPWYRLYHDLVELKRLPQV